MKNTFLALLLAGVTAAAQTPPPPTFSPLSTTGSTNSSRSEFLQRALQRARQANPNAVVDQRPEGTVSNVVPPKATRPVPFTTRTPLRPVQPAPSTPTSPPATAAAPHTTAKAPAEEMLPAGVIDFPATDLNQVLDIYAKLVGRTILRPTTLPAPTITLKTETPLTRSEAIDAFKAVLWLNGIAVEDFGDKFVKVVPSAQAGQVGSPFSTNNVQQMPEMGQFVTHIVQLTNAKPSEVAQALTPLASPGLTGGIMPIDSSQILVLRDSTENVKRMLEMIRKIDVVVPSEYVSEVIPIKYALATDIASALNALSSGGGTTTVGSSAAHGGGAAGGMGGMGMGGMGMGGMGMSPGMGSPYGGGYGGYGGMPGTMGTLGHVSPMGGIDPLSPGEVTPMALPGTTAPGGAPGSSFTKRLQNLVKKANEAGEIEVLGQTKIIADERTNSLLIFATRPDMKMIKDIVAKLDVVLAQVLIEAVIVQVTLDDSHSLGISYLQGNPSHIGNSFQGIGAVNNGTMLNSGNFISTAGTNAVGGLPSGFSYLANLGNNDLDATVTALASSTKAKILQRPRIQTSHAVPASLFVGQQRPYPVSSYYGGGAFGGYASIQQLQIGVTIQVTPLINPDGLVVMDINVQITSFDGNVTIQNVGDVPITSSKFAQSKVAVRDRDTIMLGGLIENDKSNNNSGVPFLKDIPILGNLFRSSSADNSRSELIVLIRPTVLPTPEVAALAARAENDKMPGVKQTQMEIEHEETQRLKRVNRQTQNMN